MRENPKGITSFSGAIKTPAFIVSVIIALIFLAFGVFMINLVRMLIRPLLGSSKR